MNTEQHRELIRELKMIQNFMATMNDELKNIRQEVTQLGIHTRRDHTPKP